MDGHVCLKRVCSSVQLVVKFYQTFMIEVSLMKFYTLVAWKRFESTFDPLGKYYIMCVTHMSGILLKYLMINKETQSLFR